MVAGAQVKLGEVLRAGQLVEEFADDGQGKTILDCEVIEAAVVDAESLRTILLLYREDRGCEWAHIVLDHARLEHLLHLSLNLIFLQW